MSFEVNCGKEEFCHRCPFRYFSVERAQELGKMAACFEGSIPTDTQIARIAELTDTSLFDEKDIIGVRTAATLMGIDHCRVKEI